MAIQGSGTASDPYIVVSYDELVTAINSFPQAGNTTKHIAFPSIYDGPKVIDMRDRGWIPSLVAQPPCSGDYMVEIYIHGNGWTILGLSCMGNSWWISSDSGSGCGSVTIDDLIIKNFYLLNTSNSEVALFAHTTTRSRALTLNRCKISGCLDAIKNPTSIELGARYNKPLYAYSCSFNLKCINHRSWAGFNRHGNDHDMAFFYNCIFNIVDQNNNYVNERDNSGIDYFFRGTFYFCKVTGFIKRNPDHPTQEGYYYFFDLQVPSCYNVFDFEVIDMYKLIWIDNQEGYMCGIYNKDKTTNNGTDMFHPWQPNYLYGITSAQMVDKDYLNSIDFICGDTPSS